MKPLITIVLTVLPFVAHIVAPVLYDSIPILALSPVFGVLIGFWDVIERKRKKTKQSVITIAGMLVGLVFIVKLISVLTHMMNNPGNW